MAFRSRAVRAEAVSFEPHPVSPDGERAAEENAASPVAAERISGDEMVRVHFSHGDARLAVVFDPIRAAERMRRAQAVIDSAPAVVEKLVLLMNFDVQKRWSIGGDQLLTLPVLFVKIH
jgi:hypothetical protein